MIIENKYIFADESATENKAATLPKRTMKPMTLTRSLKALKRI